MEAVRRYPKGFVDHFLLATVAVQPAVQLSAFYIGDLSALLCP